MVGLNKVFREEKKFLINVDEFLEKSHMLSQVMSEDIHNGTHGYVIRSLYFDTIYDRDYFEKISGIETRRKIRLRIYDSNSHFAMLEMKQKQGAYQLKRSLQISREEAIALTKGDYSPLLHYKERFAAECYALMNTRCYRPKTIVQYHRKAFIAKENKIRITFDSNIVATESNFDLFAPYLNMNPVLDKFNVVMEVKFNGFLLDYIRRMINSVNRSELSVSKYVLARQNGYQTRL
ncbi:MAG: polyphosphate polymerase domain-containing protein [Clostridia bacterium]|nr:polyphosphate polymerase domain-containing protein [Clostridia bacterium]